MTTTTKTRKAPTLISQVKSFVETQKNSGVKGLELVKLAVDHMFNHSGDWTPLAWLINKSEKTDNARFRAIVGAVTTGVKLVTDKDQPSGLRFILESGACRNTVAFGKLIELIEAGHSFRSEVVGTELLKKDKADPTRKSVDSMVKLVMKQLQTNKIGLELFATELNRAIAAAKAEESAIATTVAKDEAAKVKAEIKQEEIADVITQVESDLETDVTPAPKAKVARSAPRAKKVTLAKVA